MPISLLEILETTGFILYASATDSELGVLAVNLASIGVAFESDLMVEKLDAVFKFLRKFLLSASMENFEGMLPFLVLRNASRMGVVSSVRG